ncbi:hypothetical protein Nm8I071_61700 [Nonomuraea sp. TT08I-71]|nr:hypothetical protein Nm8I071_61700 [Nonomuraea sp. TT08I-71]
MAGTRYARRLVRAGSPFHRLDLGGTAATREGATDAIEGARPAPAGRVVGRRFTKAVARPG